ncbi:MAG: hypothetical protein IT385_28985 [Deltaproteobacteria bacterium]|nr:hypothetical protein [Deltaproteobacteria bacterium]
MDAPTRDAKLKSASDLVQMAVRFAGQGDWPQAAQHLEEAAGIWSGVPEVQGASDVRRLAIGAAINEARAQIAVQGGSLDDAKQLLHEALDLRTREKAAGGNPNPMQVAADCLNLSSIAHREGDNVKALDYNTRAQAMLVGDQSPPARIFYASSFEARANLLGLLNRLDEALATFDEGVRLAGELIAAEIPGGKQLRTEMLVHSARGRARTGRPREAALLVEEAAELAWDRFETSQGADKEAISHFVAAQMNLVGFAETLGEFARAEDALFKVLRLVGPDARVVERGMKLYQALLEKDDAALSAGNLPRDEVDESYRQLQAIARAAAQQRA